MDKDWRGKIHVINLNGTSLGTIHIGCSWKLSNFQDPLTPLPIHVQNFSTPLTLDIQFETICVFQKAVPDNPASSCINKINFRSKEARDALDKMFNQIKEQIVKDGNNFNTAVLKFEAIYKKLNVVQNSSALSCHEKNFLNRKRREKIKVKPTAVAKRAKKMVAVKNKITAIERSLSYQNG